MKIKVEGDDYPAKSGLFWFKYRGDDRISGIYLVVNDTRRLGLRWNRPNGQKPLLTVNLWGTGD